MKNGEDGTDLWSGHAVNLLLDAMADGVFTLNPKGEITSWNRALEEISGYATEEALGQTCALLGFSHCFGRTCPASPEECGILKHCNAETKECLLRQKSGVEVPVLKKARVIQDADGEVIGVIETLTDLSHLQKVRRQAEAANRRLAERHRMGRIIGKSHVMKRVFEAIEAAAASEATVLIQGESGTGKELVAGAIHYNSRRKNAPFVTVNCAALAESLLESELFGHVRGAFTGAIRDRVGRFEAAQSGSLFLDEIGEISPLIQVKLLRALQERVIERVGESRQRKVDIRIIAATHRDIFRRVRTGEFREDLYYRLKVFPIHLPSLRKRKVDIPLLANHFVQKQNTVTGKRISGFSPSAMRLMLDYPWPGNIRELENAVEHAFVLRDDGQIDIFDLPVEVRRSTYTPESVPVEGPATRQGDSAGSALDRDSLLELLADCGWNKAEVGRRIGVSRTSVWKYMKKWDVPLKSPLG